MLKNLKYKTFFTQIVNEDDVHNSATDTDTLTGNNSGVGGNNDQIHYQQHIDSRNDGDLSDSSIELTPLFSQSVRYYVLDTKIELGEMAGLFFNDIGRMLFYICIAIYLYGDLSIYSAAVAKTLRDVIW